MQYYRNTPSSSRVKKTDPNQIYSYDTQKLWTTAVRNQIL